MAAPKPGKPYPDLYAGKTGSDSDGKDLVSRLMIGFLGVYSKFVMHILNKTELRRAEVFQKALVDKERQLKKRGIVTVSNHTTAIDDPGALSTLISWEQCLKPQLMRYTPCATDRCFKNTAVATILRKGKVLPVQRGAGLMQGWMTDMVRRLDEGEWVHFFPEGTRSRKIGEMGKIRTGVGRLVCDAREAPIVLPFYHRGMEQVLPRGTKVPIPLVFMKQLGVFVGDPVPMDDIRREYRDEMEKEGFIHREASEEVRMIQAARLPERGSEGERRSGGGSGKLSAVAASSPRTDGPGSAAQGGAMSGAGTGSDGAMSPPEGRDIVLAHPSSDPPPLASPLSYSLPMSDRELELRNKYYSLAAARVGEHLRALEKEASEWAAEVEAGNDRQ